MTKKNKRPIGLTRDTGFQIGVRRTLPIRLEEAWRLLLSEEGLKIWLGAIVNSKLSEGAHYQLSDGTRGEIRVFSPDSHLRMTWHPVDWPSSSTIQVRVIPKGDRTVVAFHQEHLPGTREREARRDHFRTVLSKLQGVIKTRNDSS